MRVIFGLLSLSLVWSMGCASKKPKVESTNAATGSGPGIGDDGMSFNADGSDSLKIPGLYTVHFSFDKATLDTAARSNLQKDADWTNDHKNARLKIEGHCDLKGSTEYNLALGEQRAKAAKDYLIGLGVSADRLDTVSFGKEKPITTEEGDEAQAKNRRDNFVPIQ